MEEVDRYMNTNQEQIKEQQRIAEEEKEQKLQ